MVLQSHGSTVELTQFKMYNLTKLVACRHNMVQSIAISPDGTNNYQFDYHIVMKILRSGNQMNTKYTCDFDLICNGV